MKQRKYHSSGRIIVHSTKELLQMQSKGQFLNHEEKQRVKKYAEEKRKKNLCR